MREKLFYIIVAVIILGAVGYATTKKTPVEKRTGTEQPDKGRSHLRPTDVVNYGGPEPPTSGSHGEPVNKGVYTRELPDRNIIHNLEHGYVYISYRPDIPKKEVDEMTALFFAPFSDKNFAPTKIIMAPRTADASPIIMSSWRRSLKLDKFDKQTMIDYYKTNVSKSPEPFGS